MELLLEKILIYGGAGILLVFIFYLYIRKLRRQSKIVGEKIEIARQEGLFEPVSLHPVVDPNSCIQSGACIKACPEKDILGIRNGKATVINASQCVGHGACFHACPTEAISLHIGTEKRGVELPHINQNFETNVKGIFIAGEMGGMGLIKNAVEQGKKALGNLSGSLLPDSSCDYDVIIIGAGPAGIAATLQAKKIGLNYITIEQDSLGGTVFTFPRQKIVMTSAMDLPLHGKVKLSETNKNELLKLWEYVFSKNNIEIQQNRKVEEIIPEDSSFKVKINDGSIISAQKVLLAIGRRGSPRKLGITGETLPKVAYRLLDPEIIQDKHIMVVGGGDSAIESALLLMDQNKVYLSYRKDTFSRLKPKNKSKIEEAIASNKIQAILNSSLTSIEEEEVKLEKNDSGEKLVLQNDLVYIFAGGELPGQFLQKAGITITKKFGEAIMSHK